MNRRGGITVVEVLVGLSVVLLLVSLTVPALLSARESSRKLECRSRLLQIGIAVSSFEASHRRLPKPKPDDQDLLRSSHLFLLPWLDQGQVVEEIGDKLVPVRRGLVALASRKQPLGYRIPVFVCPSENGRGLSNYCYNQGSVVSIGFDVQLRDCGRVIGPFNVAQAAPQASADVRDGLSNTAAVSERLCGSYDADRFDPRRDVWFSGMEYLAASNGDDLVPTQTMIDVCRTATVFPGQFSVYSGETWGYGGYEGSWYNHVVAPNADTPYCSTFYPSDSALPYMSSTRGIFGASSLHQGSVNVLFMDGSASGVSNSIALEIWRALGTASGTEAVELPENP